MQARLPVPTTTVSLVPALAMGLLIVGACGGATAIDDGVGGQGGTAGGSVGGHQGGAGPGGASGGGQSGAGPGGQGGGAGGAGQGGAAGGPGCVIDGVPFPPGTRFSDGCNSCFCSDDGGVACTLRACPDTCTFSSSYAYRQDGGLRAYYDDHALRPARRFTTLRRHLDSDAITLCNTLVSCDGPGGVLAIEAAISHPDVQKALASSTPPHFGGDPRPMDGSIFMFVRADGRGFTLGPGSVPGGLRALEEMLNKVAVAQRDLATDCATSAGGAEPGGPELPVPPPRLD